MRILVTGASGVFGRSIVSRLAREGVDVVAFARREVPDRPHVTFARGDIRDPSAVKAAMTGCDRVVHLAWQLAPTKDAAIAEEINLGGTTNVLRAMADVGADHLVFASSITAYGAWPDNPPRFDEDAELRPDPDVLYAFHKAAAERLIAAAGVPAVITRTVVAAGRSLDNYEFRFLASPMLPVPADRETSNWQFIHSDDVGRFHVLAALGDRTGAVNVGPADLGLSLAEVAEVLDKRSARVPFKILDAVVRGAWRINALDLDPASFRAALWMPVADTTRMRTEWGYQPAFGSREALADTKLALARVIYLGKTEIVPPWRMPAARLDLVRDRPVEGVELVSANPDLAGEFDSLVDPRFPEYSCTNVGEAFPGPMTPLSLTISLDAMQASSAGMADFLGADDDEVRYAQQQYGIASFAHRLYGNFSVVRAMAERMPGSDVAGMEEQFLGVQRSEEAGSSEASLVARLAGAGRSARLAVRVLPKIATIRAEVGAICERAAALPNQADIERLTDDQLRSLMESLHDQLLDTWWISSTTNVVAAGLATAAEKLVADPRSIVAVGGLASLRSAALVNAIFDLAERAGRSPRLPAWLASTSPDLAVEQLAAVDSSFAAAFAAAVETVRHRGPGELELANPTFGQRPELLLKLVTNALDAHPRVGAQAPALRGWRVKRLATMQAGWLRAREDARDAVARVTHEVRLVALEWGRRQTDRGVLSRPDDVFFLTYDEFFAPAGIEHIERRRAERERLSRLRMPTSFTGQWQRLDEEVPAAGEESTLTGIGAAPGTAQGRVRVLRDAADDIEPGEIAVVHITDVGWTGLLAVAGAIVAEVGGTMSHAAIVARECGVPAVVSVERATSRLTDGVLVAVDGAAGTVRILDDAAHL